MARDRTASLALLTRPFPGGPARERWLDRVRELDARLERASAAPAFDPAAFARARLVGSTSLDKRAGAKDLEAWGRANELMGRYVADRAPLAWSRIRCLNAALRGLAGEAPLRADEAFLGPYRCPPAADVEALLAPMLDAVARREAEVHPIAAAALAGQWLATVHPFDDANGRTARLVGDWLLARHGYPPVVYRAAFDGFNALLDHPDGREPLGVEETASMVLHGLACAIDLIEGR